MKYFYLSAMAIAVATTSYAQPTLTGTSNNPVNGESVTSHAIDASTFNPGSSGANVTWDFSNLVSTSTTSYSFADPNTMTYGAQMNGVPNLASASAGNESYYIADANSYSVVGIVQGANDIIDNYNTDPRELIMFPITYLDSYNATMDGVQQNNVASITLDRSGTITIEADAYGTLIMPYGTVNNVLRIKTVTSYSDDYMGNTIGTYVDEHYMWYDATSHTALLDFHDFDFNGQNVKSGGYRDGAGVNVAEYSNFGTSVQLFPNPANDVMNVQYSLQSSADVQIVLTDMLGKEVSRTLITSNANGIQNASIDVSNLNKGIYLVALVSEGEVITKKITVQ